MEKLSPVYKQFSVYKPFFNYFRDIFDSLFDFLYISFLERPPGKSVWVLYNAGILKKVGP